MCLKILFTVSGQSQTSALLKKNKYVTTSQLVTTNIVFENSFQVLDETNIFEFISQPQESLSTRSSNKGVNKCKAVKVVKAVIV